MNTTTNKWTNEEVDFIKGNYWSLGPTECGSRLGRSKDGVMIKAKKLGLKYRGVKEKYSEESVRDAVNNALTISETLSNLGLRCAGGNYKVIKNYIDKYNIDISHFEPDVKKGEKENNKKTPLEKILVENSTYKRSHLKRRLIEENVLDYKCSKCGNEGEWQGEELKLQLDHINGVHNDHRYENLRFLCPNCHTQTKTFAGKKKKY